MSSDKLFHLTPEGLAVVREHKQFHIINIEKYNWANKKRPVVDDGIPYHTVVKTDGLNQKEVMINYQIDFKPVGDARHFTIDYIAPFSSKKNSLQRVTLHPQIGSSRTEHVLHNNFAVTFGD